MYSLEVFGGCLHSDLLFPELRRSRRSRPDWTLRVVDTLPDHEDVGQLGMIDFGRIAVRLFRTTTGYRYQSDDTGTFLISEHGSAISWQPAAGANPNLARIDLLNRVIPVALHAGGTLCLHGSGVVTPAGAICFLAPKFHGKSTTAMAMVSAGASLLSDDTLAVELDDRMLVRPGVHTLRLRQDSAARFASRSVFRTDGAEGKRVVAPPRSDQVARSSVPLSALYLLAPQVPGDRVRVERQLLDPVMGTMGIIGQSRLGGLFDSSENAAVLDRVVRLTERVPVFRLVFDRDFDRLDGVVEQLLAWHAADTTVHEPSTIEV